MDLDVDYATTLAAAVLLGVGFVLQQYAARQEPESRFLSPRILTDLLRKPRWLLGIGCMVAGQLLAAWSLGHAALTLVEPLLTTYLLFALILAVPMSKQPVRWSEVTGALILIVGVTLLSLSRSTKPIGLSFGSFSHWPTAAIIAGIAFVAVQVGHRTQGNARAVLTGLAAGLVFGIQDALTRQTLEILQGHPVSVLLTTWPPYCLLGAGIVGLWLMQNAFSAGPLHSSLPTIAAGEPVAGIVLGIVVFGDRIQISPGELAIEAGGIAALIVGVVMVARSSAFGSLHKIHVRTDHVDHVRPGAAEGSAGRRAGQRHQADGQAHLARQDGEPPHLAREDGEPHLAWQDGQAHLARQDAEPHLTRQDGEPHLARQDGQPRAAREDGQARGAQAPSQARAAQAPGQPRMAQAPGPPSPPRAGGQAARTRAHRRLFHGPASGEEGG